MVIYEGGDCWASTATIIRLCNMVGIKAHGRSASRDSGAGSGHQNAIALINGKYYISEADMDMNMQIGLIGYMRNH
jgi:hypothetical protein